MRRPVIISLSAIGSIAAAVAIYLLASELLEGDEVQPRVRPPLRIARAQAPRSIRLRGLSPEVTLGVSARVSQLIALDWESGRRDGGWTAHELVKRNLAWARARGFNVFITAPWDEVQRVGYFSAPEPEELGLSRGADLACFVAAQARAHELVVLADLSWAGQALDERDRDEAPGIDDAGTPRDAVAPSELAQPEALDDEGLRRISRQLLETCRFDGLLVTGGSSSLLSELHHDTLGLGKLLVHDRPEAAADADILIGSDQAAETPALLFAHARTLERPSWLWLGGADGSSSGAVRNRRVFRSIQFHLEGFVWRLASEPWIRDLSGANEAQRMVGRLGRWRLDRAPARANPTPVANVVLALPGGEGAREAREAFVMGVLPAVVNALSLSGFEVRASYGEALPEASAYVVLAMGRTPHLAMACPEFLLELLDGQKPVVLLVDGLTAEGRWRAALARVGVRAGRWAATSTRIATVAFRGHPVAWHGSSAGEVRTALLPPSAVEGENLLDVEVDDRQTVLVARSGDKTLVNSSSLARQSAFVLDQLLESRLRAPFPGDGVIGQRSAFLAREASTISVDLPVATGRELRIVRYGHDGRRQPVEVIRYEAPFKATLAAGELLVVEAGAPASQDLE